MPKTSQGSVVRKLSRYWEANLIIGLAFDPRSAPKADPIP